jgi:hypothetical protein
MSAAISSTELPLTPPDLSAWQYNDVSFGGGRYPVHPEDKVLYEVRGHITSMYLIPEPTTLLILGLGAISVRLR